MDLERPQGHVVAAWRALVRHALMTEEVESGRRPLVAVKPRARFRLSVPEVSAGVRAEYEYQFAERVSIKIDAGMDEAEAERETFDEMGCVEFWDWMGGHQIHRRAAA